MATLARRGDAGDVEVEVEAGRNLARAINCGVAASETSRCNRANCGCVVVGDDVEFDSIAVDYPFDVSGMDKPVMRGLCFLDWYASKPQSGTVAPPEQ